MINDKINNAQKIFGKFSNDFYQTMNDFNLKHINASGTQIIQGTYRNANNPVTFYLNPQTGLNVMASPSAL
ncbi:hypothetical protein FHR29_000860 [Sphingobacterium sp. JUb56]|nr:hypothetical protein [Sphingobacterium sp. JUb56]